MIDFSDPLSIITVAVPIIGGIIASVYYVNKLIHDKKDRELKIHVIRFYESNNTVRKIRVRYLNKPIERCSVSVRGYNMTWDGAENQVERTIFEGEARNITIPNDIFTEDVEVIVRSGNKILKKTKFKDLELGTP